MSETKPNGLAERLLQQDDPLPGETQEKLLEKLEQAFVAAGKMERRTRVTMIGLWVAAYLNMFLVVFLGNTLHVKVAEWYGALHFVLVVAAIVETLFYFARYRPQLTRARDERHTEMFRSLDRKLNELAKRLP